MLESYLAGEAASLFDGLAGAGLDAEVGRLQIAIDALRDVPHAHLELAADFAQLFLLDADTGALPYASAYDTGQRQLYGPAQARMRALLATALLAVRDEFKEPADHLAVHLSLMARFAEQDASVGDCRGAARKQADFLQQALLSWLPSFESRHRQSSPRFDFYPALAALLVGFVEHDARFVGELAE
jgi:TorA-specific chaperone